MESNVIQIARPRQDTRPYGWDQVLEHALAVLITERDSLWASLGQHVDLQGLQSEASRILFETVQDHALKFGRGPSTPKAFYSHLTTRVAQGSVTERQRVAALELLSEVDPDTMTLEDVRSQASEHVKKRAKEHLLEQVRIAVLKNGDTSELIRQFELVDTIGTEAAGNMDSVFWGEDIFYRIRSMRMAERISTGIRYIDECLEGGPVRGSLTTFGAGSGVGKSWTLVQGAAVNLANQARVIYIDTEMGVLDAYSRIIGNLTRLGLNDVIEGKTVAENRWKRIQHLLGPLAVFYLPHGSYSARIHELVEEAKSSPGFDGGFDLLVVDYGDRLNGRRDDRGMYERYSTVWQDIRTEATGNNAWAFTASQLKDLGDKTVPTWEDLSGSRRKGEISDNVITMWKDSDDAECRKLAVSKARKAPESEISEALVTDLAHCRIFPPTSTLDKTFEKYK